MRSRLIALAAMAALLLCVAVRGEVSPAAQAADPIFDLKPIVDGVYAAVAKPVHKINCNAVVIVLAESVLVVDTHSKPSAARALMDQIKTVTNKPVKYVVNTHFHWDHTQGNAGYASAWPQGFELLASEATREGIEQKGLPRIKREIADLPNEIAGLKGRLAKAADERQRTDIQDRLSQTERYLAELQGMQVALPSITFDKSLVIHDKLRTVHLLFLGKAHTEGDVFVYLPRERFIATGDALHQWTPYMADSYPADWIRTLSALEQLDFEYALGGHGDVMRGKTHLQAWKQYFNDLTTETTTAYASGASMAQTVARVSAVLVPKHAKVMPPTFQGDITNNIQKVYRVVSGQMN